MKKFILSAVLLLTSSYAAAYDYYFYNVKILNIEPLDYSDQFVRITLDLSDYDVATQQGMFTNACAPTEEAWVVSSYGSNTAFEAQILSIAMMAMATNSAVDVFLHDTTCNTTATYPNIAVPGSPSASGPVPGGAGRRVAALRLHLPD